MKLQSKLLLGFSAVLGIVLTMGGVLTWAMKDVNRLSQVVDNVDSGLASALISQGRGLRFLLYKDASYLDQAKASLEEAEGYINHASELVNRPDSVATIRQQKEILTRLKTDILVKMGELDQKRLEIDSRLLPLTADIKKELNGLRTRVNEVMQAGYSQKVQTFLGHVTDASNAFADVQLTARIYVGTATPENEKKTLDTLQTCLNEVKALEGQAQDPRNVESVNIILTSITRYDTIFREMVANTGATQAITKMQREEFLKMVNLSVPLSRATTDLLLSTVSACVTGLYVGIAVLFALSIMITLFLTRNVQRQLGKDPGELVDIARRVTAGDYNIDDNSPKIGVYGNIVAMVGALREHIENAQHESARAADESLKAQEASRHAEEASRQAQSKTEAILIAADKLEEVANVVSSASEELAAQIEQSERGASQQASRVTETATAMEEMNSTVLEVARSASAASEMSTKTRDKAEAGAAVVSSAVKSIREVQEQALLLKDGMTQLDENAKAINQIMGVISDIADQTNLLALNAAIEAARAGDAGRGFAVVADEVRNLAEKTMSSTTDVGNAIKAIQQSVALSMSQVASSVTIIESATGFANQSGVALQEIVTMADGTADQVRAIATASEQQSASSEEINQSITQVNAIAGETAQTMQEAARAVSDLASQAQILSRLIDDMKRS